MIKAYISGALMGAANINEARFIYEYIAEICKKNGIYPYVPHLNTDPIQAVYLSNKYVFEKDLDELLNSKIIIAYLGQPSLGVGAEVAIAIQNKIPIITFHEKKIKVSRFIKGLLEIQSNSCNIEFEGYEELDRNISNALNSFLGFDYMNQGSYNQKMDFEVL